MSESNAPPWTIGRLLVATTEFLNKRGSTSARLDAEVLLAFVLGCERIMLYTRYGEIVSDEDRTTLRELVRRRGDGEPVAYLVGAREFYGLSFLVNRDVLVPRPETESLVAETIDRVKAVESPRIADVGTGSGCIAVAIAKRVPAARVTAIDFSPAALAIARTNAGGHGVSDRVEFLEGDLLSGLPAEPTFDVVASNPPYVSEAELAGLSNDVRDHEPRMALVGGPTGLEIIERLLPQAAARLKPGGLLLIELSPMIADRALALAKSPEWTDARLLKDGAGLLRVLRAERR